MFLYCCPNFFYLIWHAVAKQFFFSLFISVLAFHVGRALRCVNLGNRDYGNFQCMSLITANVYSTGKSDYCSIYDWFRFTFSSLQLFTSLFHCYLSTSRSSFIIITWKANGSLENDRIFKRSSEFSTRVQAHCTKECIKLSDYISGFQVTTRKEFLYDGLIFLPSLMQEKILFIFYPSILYAIPQMFGKAASYFNKSYW